MAGQELSLESVTPLLEAAIAFGLDALGALAILVAGWWVAGWLKRILRRTMERTRRIDSTLRPVIASIARYAVLIIVLVAVLAQFGVQTTSIIAILGAAGLAVGLALQGTLQNIAAGFMLLFLRPFSAGDYIEAGGIGGTVEEIGLFVSQLTTVDGLHVSVPNSALWGSAITNYSRAKVRRTDLTVGIAYGDDLVRAMTVLEDLLKSDDRVFVDPSPLVQATNLGDSAVELNLRYWTAPGDCWAARCDMIQAVKLRLDAEGISIPFPQREVRVINDHLAVAD